MKRLTVIRAQPATTTRVALEAQLEQYVGRYNKTLVENKKLKTRVRNLTEKTDALNDKIRELEDLIETLKTEHAEAIEGQVDAELNKRQTEAEEQLAEIDERHAYALTRLEDIEIAIGAGRYQDIPYIIGQIYTGPKWGSTDQCKKQYDIWREARDEAAHAAERQRAIDAAHLLQQKIIIEAPRLGSRIKRRT